jgi:hypothetical protein
MLHFEDSAAEEAMAHVTSQMKGALSLTCAAVTSIASGIASRRYDQHAGWHIPACIGGASFLIQFLFIFLASKEEAELAEYKRVQSAQMESDKAKIENRRKIANAATERAVLEIESGNLDEAQRWSDFGGKHDGQ